MLMRASSCLVLLAAPLLAGEPTTTAVGVSPENLAALRAHYGRVLEELAAADTSHLDTTRQVGRERALEALAAYREAGDFGVDLDPRDRDVAFVDQDGRRCAVAWLLDDLGETELVEHIAATRNDGFVVELGGIPGLPEALDRMGLSLVEAARIQAPMGGGNDRPWADEPGDAASGPAVLSMSGPWMVGRGAVTSTSTASSASGASTVQRGASGRTGSGRRRSGATTASSSVQPLDDWRLWWEMNKLRFLDANRLKDAPRGAVSPAPVAGGSSWLGDERAQAADMLRGALGDADAEVRARAAVALARIEGRTALPAIAPLLEDGTLFVREAAILAMGASGAASAVPRLLELAQDGQLADGSSPSPAAQEIALLALGLGRRAGLRESIDPLVANWLEDQDDDPRLAHGAMLYHAMAGDEHLGADALRWLDDEDAFSVLRCRATESLVARGDPELIAPLTHALGSRDRQVRRSAALSLGQLQHPLVVGPLQTAFELERNPVTQGFLLMAMAEHGGENVRDMLADALDAGDRALRPFAALALGLQARVDNDETSRELLREALEHAGNAGERGALVLANGIARDTDAVPTLARMLVEESDPDTRMLAALSLGMTGSDEALDALRGRFGEERSELALTGVAQAVATFGQPADAEPLLGALRTVHDPALTVLVAVAVAFHGTPESLAGLRAVANAVDTHDTTRATALEALGLMLDDQPGLQLARLTRNSNYRAFPGWLVGVLGNSTL